MKKLLLLAAALCSAGMSAAEEKNLFEDKFEDTEKWFKNPACEKSDGGGRFEIVENGKSGKCLKIVTNDKQTFMFNTSQPIPAKPDSTIRISFYVKGHGSVSISPMGRTTDKTIYLNELVGEGEKISTTDWKEISFIIPLKDPNEGVKFDKIMLRMNLFPGSELLIDDFRITEKQP
ncbi:MAG: hypothetical protein BWY31_04205 [Lentisphaerae bacterium ADurb.Bin242]|nr:MAG: hypothetical protein BWY31_04205 [Lentisphaerae bacterium ADurb.Bin242]